MLKKRTIQPQIWRDEDFGKLSEFAKLIYLGLITQSDDEGLQLGHPSVICSALFPYQGVELLEKTTDALLEISKMRNIIFYTVEKQIYIHLGKWYKHQFIRKDRSQVSLFPAPPAATKQSPENSYDVMDNLRKVLETKGIINKKLV